MTTQNQSGDISIRFTRQGNDENWDADSVHKMLADIQAVATRYGFEWVQWGPWSDMARSAIAEKDYIESVCTPGQPVPPRST